MHVGRPICAFAVMCAVYCSDLNRSQAYICLSCYIWVLLNYVYKVCRPICAFAFICAVAWAIYVLVRVYTLFSLAM